jgi:hypothetical protein
MESLPIEIWAALSSYLNSKTYALLRRVCLNTSCLDPIPTLHFEAYKESVELSKSQASTKIRLSMYVVADEILLYLVEHDHLDNYLRLFENNRSRHLSIAAKEDAMLRIVEGGKLEIMLLRLLDPRHRVNLRANGDWLFCNAREKDSISV